MASINQVLLLGRVGQDPETRSFQNGGEVTNARLVTNERWKDKNSGEMKERAEWHTVAAFGPLSKILAMAKKGQEISVIGQLRTRKWKDSGGNDRYSTEVVLQSAADKIVLIGGRSEQGGASNGSSPAQNNQQEQDFDDDDIPF